MRRLSLLLLLLIGLLGLTSPGLAAEVRDVSVFPVDYTFGGQAVIRAEVQSAQPIEQVLVFIRSRGASERYVQPANVSDGQLIYIHDLVTQPLRAFSTIEYWFEIQPQGGEKYTTPVYTFDYIDNRFDWQTLSDGPFTVHWYVGEVAFAQLVLNTAQEGLKNGATLLTLPSTQPVNIYVYNNGLDMQSTLRLGGLSWVAGHADPDLGVMVVSLPPGPDQRRETERQIPHELMHLLTYQLAGPAYYNLPVWLKEGLASANELRPNADYFVILNSAVEKNTLIPLTALCQSFPQDTTVYLAYAEADSFTRYLQLTYGAAGLRALVDAYRQDAGCENGPQAAMGGTLSTLESDWRRVTFGENAVLTGLGNLMPWIILVAVSLAIPLILALTGMGKTAKTDARARLTANR